MFLLRHTRIHGRETTPTVSDLLFSKKSHKPKLYCPQPHKYICVGTNGSSVPEELPSSSKRVRSNYSKTVKAGKGQQVQSDGALRATVGFVEFILTDIIIYAK